MTIFKEDGTLLIFAFGALLGIGANTVVVVVHPAVAEDDGNGSFQIGQKDGGTAGGIAVKVAVFYDIIDQHIFVIVGFEVDAALGRGAGSVDELAIFYQQIDSADDADALPMVVIRNNIFDQYIFAGTATFAVGDVDAVAAGTFDGQVTDDDIVTAPETDAVPPLGVKIIRLFLVIFFAHFQKCALFAANSDIVRIGCGEHAGIFVFITARKRFYNHIPGKDQFQV